MVTGVGVYCSSPINSNNKSRARNYMYKYVFLLLFVELIWASDKFVSRDFQLNELYLILHIFTYFVINTICFYILLFHDNYPFFSHI